MNAARQSNVSLPEPQSLVRNGTRITLNKRGSRKYTKMSYPLHAGIYTEVETASHLLHFNLSSEIIRTKAKDSLWPHPHEWLKRTMGNDWIYYSTGGYTGVFEATGEYYLPNMPYVTNGLLGGNPFGTPEVVELVDSWPSILAKICRETGELPQDFSTFFAEALDADPKWLEAKADRIFAVCGGRSTVLPPDARHVDYNVIPLTIATGCLYKCSFCEVKNKNSFSAIGQDGITTQITSLRHLYGRDLANYNSVFLGEHDALQRGPSCILQTLEECYQGFGFASSYTPGCSAFLFGSATSLLNCPDSFFADLDQLPYSVYINIGLESADQETLSILGKPITSAMVGECFWRMQEINDRYARTEITANFIFDDNLPANHIPSFLKLVRDGLAHQKPKGCIYLSPLTFGRPSRARTFSFNRLKVLSRLPTFLYIIQRL